MATFIISDLHLGSPHCRLALLTRLLLALPSGSTLVCNGDTFDDPARPLDPAATAAWQAMLATAQRMAVILVRGNHDDLFLLPAHCPLRLVNEYQVEQRLLVVHGHAFANLLHRYRWFVSWFHRLHHLRVLLGAHPVHVAEYAKRWRPLYRVLCQSVRQAATENAAAAGFDAVTCGHVHFPEDTLVHGVRYLNTGCWTEAATYCVVVTAADLRLVEVEALLGELAGAQ